MKKNQIKISVCIPVYNTEILLAACLQSILQQDFSDFEIIIVNDGSSGQSAQGDSCAQIVKKIKKTTKIPIKYIEHKKNLGLLEARRSAVESSIGLYVCIVDSDDCLLPGALEKLYKQAADSNADIIQAGTEVFSSSQEMSSEEKDHFLKMKARANNYLYGRLENKEIFDNFLVAQKLSGFLWGKLINRELYLQALSYIPFTNCVYAEDYLQYFFISYCAKKYSGIKTPVYRYTVDTGISSSQKITDLNHWEKICSTANVFTIIFSAIEEFFEIKLSLEQIEAVRLMSRSYLVNNIRQLNSFVIPELQQQAREMLCEYWGKDFVETMERAMNE